MNGSLVNNWIGLILHIWSSIEKTKQNLLEQVMYHWSTSHSCKHTPSDGALAHVRLSRSWCRHLLLEQTGCVLGYQKICMSQPSVCYGYMSPVHVARRADGGDVHPWGASAVLDYMWTLSETSQWIGVELELPGTSRRSGPEHVAPETSQRSGHWLLFMILIFSLTRF